MCSLATHNPLPVRVCSSTLLPRCLAALVVFSIFLAMLPMLSTCLSSATSSLKGGRRGHLTIANGIFPHRLIRNTTIINRPYTTIKGGVQASCGAGHRRCIGRRSVLEIGCHALLRYSYFPPDIVPICKLDPSLLGSYRGESVIFTPQ